MKIIDVDKVFVINLKKRTDRLETIKNDLDNLGIEFERFEAIEGGISGCAQSHYEVIKLAKMRGYENILILEDDALFLDNFHSRLDSHQYPKDYDMIYLGAGNLRKYENERGVVKIKACTSSHAIIINKKIYDALLECNDFSKHIDDTYSQIMEYHNVYAIDPALVIQRAGKSDIVNIKYDPSEFFIVN